MRYLAGTTRLPFVPEFGCGIWSHHPNTPTAAEEEFVTLAALMHGMRAVNFYMLVERERWQGSPITRHGKYRSDYADFYSHLSAFLQQYPLGTFSRQKQVVALLNYDLGRYEAMTSTLHYAHVDILGLPAELSEVDLDLGFRWDVAREADRHQGPITGWGRSSAQLQQRQLDYDLADSHIDPQRLQQYAFACIPTVDFMDAIDQQRLLNYVEAGGFLIIGPGVPYLDSLMQPCSVLSKVIQEPGEVAFGCGKIICVPTEALAATLARHLPAPSIRWDAPEIDVVEQTHERQRLLFIANPTEQTQQVTLSFDTSRLLVPVWGGHNLARRAAWG